MKSLIIAEKPSVARDIARVLQCGKNLTGAFEGKNHVVTWGLGHLVTLAEPEDYDPKYKEWKMEHLPMMPEQFKLEVIKQTGKQYRADIIDFKERRAKEGAGVSKKDVANYLSRQGKETEAPVNTAFADAFAQLYIDGKQ